MEKLLRFLLLVAGVMFFLYLLNNISQGKPLLNQGSVTVSSPDVAEDNVEEEEREDNGEEQFEDFEDDNDENDEEKEEEEEFEGFEVGGAPSEPQGNPATDNTVAAVNQPATGDAKVVGATATDGCYPQNQLNASDLLPADNNSKWAQVNNIGKGELGEQNFLVSGHHIGVNTVGQSLRNANRQNLAVLF